MKKVSSEITFKKTKPGDNYKAWEMFLPNINQLKHDVLEVFKQHNNAVEICLDIEIKSPFLSKTNKQLGYLHAAIYKPFYAFYRDCGYNYSDTQVQTQLKMNPEVNFTEEIYDPITGHTYVEPKSMADATKEEATIFIEHLIHLASLVGIVVEPPEVYRIRNGITKEEFYKWKD